MTSYSCTKIRKDWGIIYKCESFLQERKRKQAVVEWKALFCRITELKVFLFLLLLGSLYINCMHLRLVETRKKCCSDFGPNQPPSELSNWNWYQNEIQ